MAQIIKRINGISVQKRLSENFYNNVPISEKQHTAAVTMHNNAPKTICFSFFFFFWNLSPADLKIGLNSIHISVYFISENPQDFV